MRGGGGKEKEAKWVWGYKIKEGLIMPSKNELLCVIGVEERGGWR